MLAGACTHTRTPVSVERNPVGVGLSHERREWLVGAAELCLLREDQPPKDAGRRASVGVELSACLDADFVKFIV